MVRVPRIKRLRIPARLTQRWRARLRAQRRWWRRRWRDSLSGEVLFPADGAGMVAVGTLSGHSGVASTGPRIVILHVTAGSGHKRAAESLAIAITERCPDA